MAATLAAGTQAPAPTRLTAVVDRAEHWRTWQTTTYLTDPAGHATVNKVSEYTELNNGVCYRDEAGQWQDSQDLVELTASGGAAAVHGSLKAYFSANLNTPGAITLTTARGRLFKSHPLGLYYRDLASGRVALIAPVRDTVGVLVPPNMVVYSNALAGVGASFLYVYAHNGFDQSLVLSEAPPSPDLLAGFNPATTRLEVWTALDQWPEPLEERPAVLKWGAAPPLDLVDRLLIFEEGFLPVGAAYVFGNAEMPAPGQAAEVRVASPSDSAKVMVAKSRLRIGNQSVLVEAVDYADLTGKLSALPPAGRRAQGAKPAAPKGSVRKYAAAAVRETPSKVALAVASAGSLPRGVLVDWSYMPSPVNNTVTLAAGSTYYIPSSFYWGGSTVFNSGCVVKFKQNAYCLMYGPVSFPSSGAQCVFTSKDDDEKGDQITGADSSTGCPSQAAAQAIWLYYETQPTTVNHALVRWAQRGVEEDENPGVYNYPSINATAFENCNVGVYLNMPNDTLYLSGDTTCNVTTPLGGNVYGHYSGSLQTSCTSVSSNFLIPGGDTGPVPLTKDFLDQSTGSTRSFNWNFGDGTQSTTSSTHTYTTPGFYTVTLTVTGDLPNDQRQSSHPLVAYGTVNFSVVQSQPSTTITFSDTSQLSPASHYTWDFGDGNVMNNDPNSVEQHTYAQFGTYTATMTACYCTPNDCAQVPRTQTIYVYPAIADASFMAYHEAEPAIAIDPTLNSSGHHTIYVFSGRPSDLSFPNNPDGLMQSFSTDGGVHWTSSLIATGNPGDLPKQGGGDVCAVYDAQGDLFLSYLTGCCDPPYVMSVIVAERKVGANWTRVDNGIFARQHGGGLDQPWLAIGPSGSSYQSLWVCYMDGPATKNGNNYVMTSGTFVDNSGSVGGFTTPVGLATGEPGFYDHQRIAIGPSGQVVCVFQDAGVTPGHIYYSANGSGLTGSFGAPSPGSFTTPASFLQLTSLWGPFGATIPATLARGIANSPEIAWDRQANRYLGSANGRVYVAYANQAGPWPDIDVYAQYADYTSSALHWNAANSGSAINNDASGTSQFFPAIAVDQASGKVAVGWYDGRCDPGDSTNHQKKVQFYAAVSSDGGQSFGGNFALTPGQSNASVPPLNWNGRDAQDYLDYNALGFLSGVLYAAWADNSNAPVPNYSGDNEYLDIYVAIGIPGSP